LINDTLRTEFGTAWCGRLCHPVGEEHRDLSRIEWNCTPQRELARGKKDLRVAGAFQFALHLARLVKYETGDVAGAGV
jgi:hypothetical protein